MTRQLTGKLITYKKHWSHHSLTQTGSFPPNAFFLIRVASFCRVITLNRKLYFGTFRTFWYVVQTFHKLKITLATYTHAAIVFPLKNFAKSAQNQSHLFRCKFIWYNPRVCFLLSSWNPQQQLHVSILILCYFPKVFK